MKLFGSVYKADFCSNRVERFIQRCNNSKKLARLIRESSSEMARKKAIAKLEDQAIIKELAEELGENTRSLSDHSLSGRLIEKVSDENWLKSVYRNAKLDMGTRLSALRQIKDQSFLLDVVERYDGDNDVSAAVENLKFDSFSEERVLGWMLRPPVDPDLSVIRGKWQYHIFANYSFSLEALNRLDASTSNEVLHTMIRKKRLGILLSEEKGSHEMYEAIREAYERHEIKDDVYNNAMRQLYDSKDIEHALIEYKNPIGSDGIENVFRVVDTWAWEKLSGINDREILLSIARNANANVIRWKACKLSGGHFFPTEGNLCRCDVCRFEKHPAPHGTVSGQPYHCEHCGGLVEANPFSEGLPHSTVTYPDGKECSIDGYDGLQYEEEQFAERYHLF